MMYAPLQSSCSLPGPLLQHHCQCPPAHRLSPQRHRPCGVSHVTNRRQRRAAAQPFYCTAKFQTVCSVSAVGIQTPADDAPAAQPYTTHSWRWRSHKINYAVAGCGKPILMVHGFGASIGHWKKNIPALAAAGYQVWALDLLGQGASDKPQLGYTIELWAELVRDFLADFVDQPAVLVGNSVGSLVCLTVNAEASAERIAGTVLVNCSGGLNNKAITQDWRIRLALPLFWAIDFLLSKPRIARYLFDRFRSKDNLRTVLKNVYMDEEAVDDALVDMLFDPSNDVGALDAFVSIITGPPGPPPAQLLPSISGPLLVLWGDSDVFTPLNGPVGQLFKALPATREDTEFRELAGQNHCVHDDNPALVNDVLLGWLQPRH